MDSITGEWHQGKGILPLNLKRTDASATFNEIKRPQTPKPPFNYYSTDVEYDNADKTIHFGATFTKPDNNVDKKYPVVILITGSGKQDRDENIFEHKPFFVIADYLAKHGVAVLRVDDRGMGITTGNYATSTSADFANDVEAGISYLRSRKDIDLKKIGLIGHSEGGLIAPMVAARNKNVAFIVVLAGPGAGGAAANDYQNILPLLQGGVNGDDIKKFLELHHSLRAAALNIKDDKEYNNNVSKIFFDWKMKQTATTLHSLIHGTDDIIISSLQKAYSDFRTPWWHFFLTYQPATDIQKLSIPVLALNGEKDVQVDAKINLPAIHNALQKSRSKNFKTIELPGLNHLFQHCKKCTIEEYSELEETFSPEVLKIMGDWIQEVVK